MICRHHWFESVMAHHSRVIWQTNYDQEAKEKGWEPHCPPQVLIGLSTKLYLLELYYLLMVPQGKSCDTGVFKRCGRSKQQHRTLCIAVSSHVTLFSARDIFNAANDTVGSSKVCSPLSRIIDGHCACLACVVREVDEGVFLKPPLTYCFLDSGDRYDGRGWQKSNGDMGR